MKAVPSMALTAQVCVDASLVVALLAPERFSQLALSLWEKWITDDYTITAPRLLRYEVTTALYRKAFQGLISWEDEHAILSQFITLDIVWDEPTGLPVRASELARMFQRPNTYDAYYLAQAEILGCPLWTADERLYNTVRSRFSQVRWLGEGTG